MPSPIQFDPVETNILNQELEILLTKGVIEPAEHLPGEFISNVFMRQKRDGTFRLILNLKFLNQHVEHHHFKMDTIQTAISLIKRNCFFTSIDLMDAYFSIPIMRQDRKYLRFLWHGKLFQFTCLAQGLSSAPRIFTKMLKPAFSVLRKQGYTNVPYIDDSLQIEDSEQECKACMQATVTLLDGLGLTVKIPKCVLEPTQIIEFLGFILNSVLMIVSLTQKKKEKRKSLCSSVVKKPKVLIREMAELIGNLVASTPGVMYARLFYKRLEIAKNKALSESKGNFDASMLITENEK